MENRNGLLVDLQVSQATGSSKREAAEKMVKRQHLAKYDLHYIIMHRGFQSRKISKQRVFQQPASLEQNSDHW